ncbi:MAG: hypothetical protein ACAH59_00690 [Pseudobdellovibrionaceae bacterium]
MRKALLLVALFFTPLSVLGQDQCSKTCVIDSECGVGGVCTQGSCQLQKNFCFNERWSANERGEGSNCDAYRCLPETGLCLRQAQSSMDCLTGYVFDGSSTCLPSVQCNSSEVHCQQILERWKKAREDYELTTPAPQLPVFSCLPCETSEVCGSSQMCWNKRCVPQSPFCQETAEGQHQQVDSGLPKDCGFFACEKSQGLCFRSCLKDSDCRSGRKCMASQCL